MNDEKYINLHAQNAHSTIKSVIHTQPFPNMFSTSSDERKNCTEMHLHTNLEKVEITRKTSPKHH